MIKCKQTLIKIGTNQLIEYFFYYKKSFLYHYLIFQKRIFIFLWDDELTNSIIKIRWWQIVWGVDMLSWEWEYKRNKCSKDCQS